MMSERQLTAWEVAADWYKAESIRQSIECDQHEIPSPADTEAFAAWLTEQYRLAMMKGIQLTQQRAEKAERERDELRELIEMVHPRVFKLAAKGEFICIGEHEPYFMRAYAMIREHELRQGSWSEDDRARYAAAQLKFDDR